MTIQTVEPPRYVRLRHGTVRVGQLATTNALHSYAPDAYTGSTRLACYGWADDPRHLIRPTLLATGAELDGRTYDECPAVARG